LYVSKDWTPGTFPPVVVQHQQILVPKIVIQSAHSHDNYYYYY